MSSTTMHDGRVVLHQGDSRDVLRGTADNSIDSIVCDPPYALVSIQKRFGKPGSAPAQHGTDGAYARAARGFMGKDWDVGETAFAETFWAECLRVLKPGGHVVAFGGTRTYHRLVCAIEDAGFEIRDQLGWVYGSGFPKSHNQSGEWQGWGSALKPAWEPICLARKPLTGTIARNLADWGVGALNIDGCRVQMASGETVSTGFAKSKASGVNDVHEGWKRPWQEDGEYHAKKINAAIDRTNELGRWPANIVHDGSDEVVGAFPDAAGQQGKVGPEHGEKKSRGIYGNMGPRADFAPRVEIDTSAARFFYCAKASRKDRDEGLAAFGTQVVDVLAGHRSRRMDEVKRPDGAPPAIGKNIHPTVKPTSLMQWLCRLITPPGGTILDPFMGSGSTGKAAVLEGFNFVGIEREDEYMPIAEARIAWAVLRVQGGIIDVEPSNDNSAAAASRGDLFGAAA